VICRQRPTGLLDIAAGHHRIQAALDVGVTQAELMVRDDLDDLDMVRIYARENGTQRGYTNTALAGSVASALRLLTKIVLTGNAAKFRSIFTSPHKTKHDVESGEGIGRDIIFGRAGVEAGSQAQEGASALLGRCTALFLGVR
jgi:hypothetical protein